METEVRNQCFSLWTKLIRNWIPPNIQVQAHMWAGVYHPPSQGAPFDYAVCYDAIHGHPRAAHTWRYQLLT